MNAGILNRVVELFKEVITTGEYGDDIIIKESIGVIRAAVKQLKGDEVLRFNEVIDTEIVKFIIRYRPEINTKYLIKYKDEFYNITQVKEMGRKESLELITFKVDE